MSVKVTAQVLGLPVVDGNGHLSVDIVYKDVDNGYNYTNTTPLALTGIVPGLTALLTDTAIATAVRDAVNAAFGTSRTLNQIMLWNGSTMFL